MIVAVCILTMVLSLVFAGCSKRTKESDGGAVNEVTTVETVEESSTENVTTVNVQNTQVNGQEEDVYEAEYEVQEEEVEEEDP